MRNRQKKCLIDSRKNLLYNSENFYNALLTHTSGARLGHVWVGRAVLFLGGVSCEATGVPIDNLYEEVGMWN